MTELHRPRLDRRTLLTAGAAAALLATPGKAVAQSGGELVLVGSGGALSAAFKANFFDPFTKETGIRIRFVPTADAEMLAKLKAMSDAGSVEWDIVSANLDQVAQFQQYFAPIDCAALPHVASDGIPGTCDGHSVLKQLDGNMLTFSTAVYPASGRQPKDWADFWDLKTFPGTRSLPDHGVPWVVIAAALMADGVKPGDVRAPLDLDRGFRKLNEIKPHVNVWWKTGDQSQQITRSGDAAMLMMYSGRALRSKSQGAAIDVTWNQAVMAPGRWAVVKDAPHPKAIMQFLDFFLTRPEAHAAFTKEIFYDTANKDAVQYLPAGERPNSALYKDNLSNAVQLDYTLASWLAQNNDALLERWNTWISS
jgi:mannopine transport system substrate-binding protein